MIVSSFKCLRKTLQFQNYSTWSKKDLKSSGIMQIFQRWRDWGKKSISVTRVCKWLVSYINYRLPVWNIIDKSNVSKSCSMFKIFWVSLGFCRLNLLGCVVLDLSCNTLEQIFWWSCSSSLLMLFSVCASFSSS